MNLTLHIPPSSFVEMPWKNGGGTTLEIFRGVGLQSSETWDWRLSMARLDSKGPFSQFQGIDRILTFLGPGLMALTVASATTVLNPLEGLAFAGDVASSANVTEPPAWDLNLMGRRDAVSIAAQTIQAAHPVETAPGMVVGVYAATGAVVIGGDWVKQGGVGLQSVTESGSILVAPQASAQAVVFTVTPN